jgi:hypothetical protein
MRLTSIHQKYSSRPVLFFVQVIFLSSNNVHVIANRVACKISAIMIHFSILCSFFWTRNKVHFGN